MQPSHGGSVGGNGTGGGLGLGMGGGATTLQDMQQRLGQTSQGGAPFGGGYPSMQQQQGAPQLALNGSHGGAGGMNMASMQQFQQSMSPQQLAALQQQQQQPGGLTNPAFAMMQQQQQQQQQQQAGGGVSSGQNTSMFGGWNNMGGGFGGAGGASSMDASSGSSARLMEMAGLGLKTGNKSGGGGGGGLMDGGSSTMQNMQALLQQQQQQQGQNMHTNHFGSTGASSSSSSTGNPNHRMLTADKQKSSSQQQQQQQQQQLLIQRQLASLQKQVNQPQQQQPQGAMQMPGLPHQGNNSAALFAQQQQQQLLQQMQQQQQQQQGANQMGMNPPPVLQSLTSQSDLMNMMQLQPPQQQQQQQQQQRRSVSAGNQMNPMFPGQNQTGGAPDASSVGTLGTLNEQRLRLQQQSLLRSTSAGQSHQQQMNTDFDSSSQINPQQQQMSNLLSQQMRMNPAGGSSSSSSGNQHGGLQFPNPAQAMSGNQTGMQGLMQTQTAQYNMPQQQGQGSVAPIDSSTHSHHSAGSGGTSDLTPSDQKSLMDGRFAGGWQSNEDLPDRRRIILRIIELIQQMRPDTNHLSDKLPRMAKTLEEHLYRSAHTKQDYLNFATLKDRLQAIAHGLELHRSSSNNSANKAQNPYQSMQQQQQQQPHHQGSMSQQFGSTGTQSMGNVFADAPGSNNSNAQTGLPHQQQNSAWSNSTSSTPQMAAMMSQGSMNNLAGQATGGMNSYSAQTSLGQNLQHGNISSASMTAMNNMGNNNSSGANTGTNPQLGQFQQNAAWSSSSSNNGSTNPMSQSMQSLMQQQQVNRNSFSAPSGMQSSQQLQQQGGAGLDYQQQNSLSQNNGAAGMMGQRSETPGSLGSSSANPGWNNTGVVNSQVAGMTGGSGSGFSNNPKFQDPEAAQKKKVILQQQQRLLLLRHASKCNAGTNCSTKFCSQMVTLWKHMKTCRDKNCKTPHCVSSRCVLNHYRICKSNGKTATCEVCGPVMLKIKQQERDYGSSMDPLTKDQESARPDPSMGLQGMTPQMQMQQQQQQQIQQQQQLQQQQAPGNNDQAQLQQIQEQRMKLKEQLDNLKQLQKQQEQLLEQQRNLEEQARHIKDPNTQEGQQLQQQQILLQQLQKRCQQSQLLLQQGLQLQSSSLVNAQSQQQQQQQQDLQMQQQQHPNAQLTGMTQSDGLQMQSPSPAATPAVASSSESVQGQTKRRSSQQARGRREGGKGKRLGKGKTLQLNAINLGSSSGISEPTRKRPSSSASNPKERSSKKSRSQASTKTSAAKSEAVSKSHLKDDTEQLSLVASMTKEEIEKHLDSLDKRTRMSCRTVTHKCMPVIQELIDDPFGWVFHDAVDPVALGLPDYFDVVKTPMHLALVKKKLENAIYSDMDAFKRDVKLVFENAILYNGEASEVGQLAQTMLDKLDVAYGAVVQDIESSQHHLESKGEACSLCGSQKRELEPAELFCQGQCGMQRIQRHATYYTDRTKQNHWCETCYGQLQPDDPITLDDGSEIKKHELQECKHDALAEEAWVNCDECQCWVHQICALFNGRTNKTNVRYTCPRCYLRKIEIMKPCAKVMKGASDLSQGKLTSALENGIKAALDAQYQSKALEQGIPVDQVEKAEGLTVRVLSNVEKKHFVGEEMLKRYGSKGFPSEFPVRSKCIALFQKIHGVDTLLFALYVYEYGDDCPAPNKRRVYVSYLDSVQYFEPKCYRSVVYQSILVEYLRYVKERGFHTAHVWSCPPAQGDDYVFHCHPSHQSTPREDMLRSWYHQILEKAKSQGIVVRSTTMYDEYFGPDGVDAFADPTCLPYFEGDYIPGEIENILKQKSDVGNELGPVALQDQVMRRLAHNLGKMKDNFIVIHLKSRGFVSALERGEDLSSWTERNDNDMWRTKRAKISEKDSSVLCARGKDTPKMQRLEMEGGVMGNLPESSLKRTESRGKCSDSGSVLDDPFGEAVTDSNDPISLDDGRDLLDTSEKSCISAYSSNQHSESNEEAGLDQTSAKESSNEDGKSHGRNQESEGGASLSKDQGDSSDPLMGNLGKTGNGGNGNNSDSKQESSFLGDTTDEDESIESEMFETRQQFLNYCLANHCQFDELRRAKHSTLLVLYQLHNPMAPKFLQQCGACYRDITHGTRYHCNQCSNYDLCEECYQPVTSGACDPRFVHDKTHTFTSIDMEASMETQKGRDELKKSLKAHIELLEHACQCQGSCGLQNCQRMKELLTHVSSCEVTPKRDCKVCTRLLALCTVHSRTCAVRNSCRVPFCDKLRERSMRLRRQQKLMDDRRREAQNELYHAGTASAAI